MPERTTNIILVAFLLIVFFPNITMTLINLNRIIILKIKGGKMYTLMTVLILFYAYACMPFLSMKLSDNKEVEINRMLFVFILGIVLGIAYLIYSFVFLTKNLKKGVSRQQDTQRRLCMVNLGFSTVAYISMLIYVFVNLVTNINLLQTEDSMKLPLFFDKLNPTQKGEVYIRTLDNIFWYYQFLNTTDRMKMYQQFEKLKDKSDLDDDLKGQYDKFMKSIETMFLLNPTFNKDDYDDLYKDFIEGKVELDMYKDVRPATVLEIEERNRYNNYKNLTEKQREDVLRISNPFRPQSSSTPKRYTI